MADRKARLSNKPFTPPQEETTLTKYSSSLCRLLLFLLRVHAKAESEGAYKLMLGEGAVKLVEGLGSTLHKAVSGLGGTWSDLELQRIVHRLSFSIFTSETALVSFQCTTQRFIILSNLTRRGAFEPAENITPKLAGLQYCLRSVIFEEMYQKLKQGEGFQ
jgi:hypothetical protein